MTKKIFMMFILLTSAICCHSQTITDVRNELQRQGIPCADIVLAQARLETGNFKSRRCRVDKNIFGIKHGKRYATYRRWQDCVSDYKRRISNRYSGGDYYQFLRRIKYAADERYISKLKRF